jgi:hypothetical protein
MMATKPDTQTALERESETAAPEKPSIATSLERSKAALKEFEAESAAITAKRNKALLEGAGAVEVQKYDREIQGNKHAAQTERDRIVLLEQAQVKERDAERLGQRMERISAVELLLQQRDAVGAELVAAIAALDSSYHKLFILAAEIRNAYAFKLIDCAPILVSETAIEQAVAAEMWRVLGRAPVTGGMPSGPENAGFPNLKAVSFQSLGNPSIVTSFEKTLQTASQLASSIMREGKTTGAAEPAAADGGRSRMQYLIGEQMRLAELPQNEETERLYQKVIDEMASLPIEGTA